MQFMKTKFDKKVEALQEKCDKLENDVKEKEKENKLHALKIKDLVRAQREEITRSMAKKLPDLNSTVDMEAKKLSKLVNLNSSVYESEPSARSRSIDPKRIKLRAQSKIDTNLKVSHNKGRVSSKLRRSKKQFTSNSNFKDELSKASITKIPVIDTNNKSRVSDAPGKNALLKKIFDAQASQSM